MKITLKILFAAMLLSAVSAFGNIVVYVGYADNLRPSGFFPNPWLCASGVVSQSACVQSFDTGAIRIDNTGASAATISGFTVTFGGGQMFNFWAPLTIPAGGKGIFTQTAFQNFDTSDFGLFGAGPVNVDATHPLGGCTNPQGPAQTTQCVAFEPKVTFSVNAAPATTFTDSGHILDTFGYDLINLPPPGGDGNESINWNLIGSEPSRGGTTPEPGTLVLLGSGLLGAISYVRRCVNM